MSWDNCWGFADFWTHFYAEIPYGEAIDRAVQQVSAASSDTEECRAHLSEQREGSTPLNEAMFVPPQRICTGREDFFLYMHGARTLAIACSWQGTSSSWLRRRAGNGG